MLIAKITGLIGLVLFVGGATGSLGLSSLAIGAVLLLLGAATGAVVLEDRDLQLVAGLGARPVEDADMSVIDQAMSSAALDPPVRPAA